MSRPTFLRLCLASLCVALLASCGGKALGSETTGKAGFRAATGPANFQLVAEADRDRRPKFSGKTFAGGTLGSNDLTGSVTVVNFFASWCGPCRKEERKLEAVWKEYQPRGVRFVGVNTRDTKADARSFLEEFGVTYPAIFDPYARIAYHFRVIFLPVTYVLDKQGRVAVIVVGAVTEPDELRKVLDQELAA